MKLLLLDIETAPHLAAVWGLWQENIPIDRLIKPGYTLCWAAKWYGSKEIYFDSILSGDKKMIRGIHKLLNEADAVCHYNGCVVAGNRVLTKDLRWVDVASLKEGDELLAFEEEPIGPNKPRKYEISKVVKAFPILKECSEILLSDGTKLIASNDHPWLTFPSPASRNLGYVETSKLENGRLVKLLSTWDSKNDYSAGYLSAFFDGEGCLSQVRRNRSTPSEEYMFNATFAQKDSGITDRLLRCLDDHKFKYSVTNYDPSQPEMKCIRILGGLPEIFRFLGSIRPQKLTRLDYYKLNHAKVCTQDVLQVVSVTPVGLREVIGLETTSKTYIVEGFPCHNSKFDIPILNKEFLLQGLNPPAPFKQIDLLRTARSRFKLASNKLDFVANELGLGKKVRHKGLELWFECMAKNPEAWVQMKEYNIRDVTLLEDVYDRLLPWIKNHPNLSTEKDASCCPKCGHGEAAKRGFALTTQGRYQRFQCNSCGTWYKSNTNLRPKGPRYTEL